MRIISRAILSVAKLNIKTWGTVHLKRKKMRQRRCSKLCEPAYVERIISEGWWSDIEVNAALSHIVQLVELKRLEQLDYIHDHRAHNLL